MCSYILTRTSYIGWEYDVILDQPAWLDLNIALPHWHNNPRVEKSLHSDTLSGLQQTGLFSLLLFSEWLAEKQQISIVLSLVWPRWVLNSRCVVLEASTLTITPPVQCLISEVLYCLFNDLYVTEKTSKVYNLCLINCLYNSLKITYV